VYRQAEAAFRAGLQPLLAATLRVLFRLEFRGAEHLPRDGPAVVVANHQGYLDPLFVSMATPRPIRFLMTSDFYDVRAARPLFDLFGAIRVSMRGVNRDSVRRTLATLRRGELVGVFPEGRLSRDGRIGKLNPGAVFLAAKSGVPVVPARIRGSIDVLPKGEWLPRQASVSVRFGRPFRLSDPRDHRAADRIRDAWEAL